MSFIEHSEPEEIEMRFDKHRKPPSLEAPLWEEKTYGPCMTFKRAAEDTNVLAALESLKQRLFTLSEGLSHSDVHDRRGLDIAIREVLKLERRYGKV